MPLHNVKNILNKRTFSSKHVPIFLPRKYNFMYFLTALNHIIRIYHELNGSHFLNFCNINPLGVAIFTYEYFYFPLFRLKSNLISQFDFSFESCFYVSKILYNLIVAHAF